METDRLTAPRRNVPARRCGLYQQVLARRDVVGGDYTEGFRAFAVRIDGPRPPPEHVAHIARRLGMEVTRPQDDVWAFLEVTE
jgi:hypothetical protein